MAACLDRKFYCDRPTAAEVVGVALPLATMRQLGASLSRVLTYDERLSSAASTIGLTVVAPR